MNCAALLKELAEAPGGLAVDDLSQDALDQAIDAGLAEVFDSWSISYVRLTDAGRRDVGLPPRERDWIERALSSLGLNSVHRG